MPSFLTGCSESGVSVQTRERYGHGAFKLARNVGLCVKCAQFGCASLGIWWHRETSPSHNLDIMGGNLLLDRLQDDLLEFNWTFNF